MIGFQTNVGVNRPIEQVFRFVSDPLLFPRWHSAVQAVRKTSAGNSGVASTYSMERELPSGRAHNELEVVASEPPREFAIRKTSGPTPFVYRYRFTSNGAGTLVHLDASVELSGVASLFGPLAASAVRRGVDANLDTLKRILDAGTRHPHSAPA